MFAIIFAAPDQGRFRRGSGQGVTPAPAACKKYSHKRPCDEYTILDSCNQVIV